MFNAIFLILLATSLLSGGGNFVFAQESTSSNAATYYSLALGDLKYPRDKHETELVHEVISKGWQQSYNDTLVGILQENKLALDNLRKGLLCPTCDFSFGKKYKYCIDEPLLSEHILHMSELLSLEGCYFESKGKFKDALCDYLYLLKFSSHISMQKSTIAALFVFRIEQNILKVLSRYLYRHADGKDCAEISNALDDYLKHRLKLVELIPFEKEMFLSGVKTMVEESTIHLDKKGISSPSIVAFKQSVLQEAEKLAEKYYALLEQYLMTGNHDTWREIEEGIKQVTADVKSSPLKIISGAISSALKRDSSDLDKKISSHVAESVFVVSFPHIFQKFLPKYNNSFDDLDVLRVDALRCAQ